MDIKVVLGDAYHEGMTAEEIETALADIEMVPKTEVDTKYVPKATADKYASEAAKYRKERNASQTDVTALNERIKELEKINTVSSYKARFVSQGMEDGDAQAAAEAMADGDISKVFELQDALLAKTREKAKSDKLHDMSAPPAGTDTHTDVDYDKLLAEAEKAGNIALMVSLTRQKSEAAAKKH